MLGDLLRYTVSPLLGWLQMPLLKWAMFSPARVPARFQAEYSTGMALRPSQIRATSEDGALMIPGALALRGGYKDLTLPVTIIAGEGDNVVFKKRSEQLAANIPGSMLQSWAAGHMVHYAAPELVVEAVKESGAEPRNPSATSRPPRPGAHAHWRQLSVVVGGGRMDERRTQGDSLRRPSLGSGRGAAACESGSLQTRAAAPQAGTSCRAPGRSSRRTQ